MIRASLGALAALALTAGTAFAQSDYPAREIRSVCAFGAGTGADVLCRYYSDQIGRAHV